MEINDGMKKLLSVYYVSGILLSAGLKNIGGQNSPYLKGFLGSMYRGVITREKYFDREIRGSPYSRANY